MKELIARCNDLNSKYCPCLLATTNHCVFCSKLQGRSVCECNWAGVCIMYEKHWKEKAENNKLAPVVRLSYEGSIISKVKVGLNTYLIEFVTEASLADALRSLGSFVFLRGIHDMDSYYFPVGIMKVVENKITVVVEGVGAKSEHFLSAIGDEIMIKGPYSNGILGKPWIDNITNGKILLVAGGIGQAPALPIIEKLLKNKNKIIGIFAPGKVGTIFIEKMLANSEVEIHTVTSLRKEGFKFLKELFMQNHDLIVSAGPDEQHSAIIRLMNESNVNLPMAATNNATMCCGEGICGSCHKLMKNNKVVKMCKVQTEYKDIMPD